MALYDEYSRKNAIRFTLDETTGAIGDLITVFPVVIAVAALTELALTHLLLGFGVFQIVWGLYYELPISVEPMKALAALVIAGTLTANSLSQVSSPASRCSSPARPGRSIVLSSTSARQ